MSTFGWRPQYDYSWLPSYQLCRTLFNLAKPENNAGGNDYSQVLSLLCGRVEEEINFWGTIERKLKENNYFNVFL